MDGMGRLIPADKMRFQHTAKLHSFFIRSDLFTHGSATFDIAGKPDFLPNGLRGGTCI